MLGRLIDNADSGDVAVGRRHVGILFVSELGQLTSRGPVLKMQAQSRGLSDISHQFGSLSIAMASLLSSDSRTRANDTARMKWM